MCQICHITMLRDALLCGTTKIPLLIAQVSSAMSAACMVALIGLNTMTIADIVKLNLGADGKKTHQIHFLIIWSWCKSALASEELFN